MKRPSDLGWCIQYPFCQFTIRSQTEDRWCLGQVLPAPLSPYPTLQSSGWTVVPSAALLYTVQPVLSALYPPGLSVSWSPGSPRSPLLTCPIWSCLLWTCLSDVSASAVLSLMSVINLLLHQTTEQSWSHFFLSLFHWFMTHRLLKLFLILEIK